MKIRKACESDLSEIGEIEKEIFSDAYSSASIKELFHSFSCFMVCESEEGSIEGYALLYGCEETAELLRICVRKTKQGNGIGKQLLNEVIKIAAKEKYKEILLEVRASNQKAIKLYRNSQFIQIALRKNYYEDKEDALIMRLELAR